MKTVIFDMDGVLFDTERIYTLAWDYAGEKAGIGKAGFMNALTLGMSVDKSQEIWRRQFGAAYDEKTVRFYAREFVRGYLAEHGIPEKEGMRELLAYLRDNGWKMAVASSSPRSEVERNLALAGIEGFFGAVVCGDMVPHSKPDPDIYIKACELLGEKPANCFAIEDSRNGIISAVSAGCKTIMVPDLWECDHATKKILHLLADSLTEVRQHFESISAAEADELAEIAELLFVEGEAAAADVFDDSDVDFSELLFDEAEGGGADELYEEQAAEYEAEIVAECGDERCGNIYTVGGFASGDNSGEVCAGECSAGKVNGGKSHAENVTEGGDEHGGDIYAVDGSASSNNSGKVCAGECGTEKVNSDKPQAENVVGCTDEHGGDINAVGGFASGDNSGEECAGECGTGKVNGGETQADHSNAVQAHKYNISAVADNGYIIIAYEDADEDVQRSLIGFLSACKWGAGRYLAELLTTREIFTDDDRAYFMLDGDQVVSFLTLAHTDCIDDDTMPQWIGFVYTAPAYRGCRNMGKLLAFAEQKAREKGFSQVFLATDHVGLYEKYGFRYIRNMVDRNDEDSRIYVYDL